MIDPNWEEHKSPIGTKIDPKCLLIRGGQQRTLCLREKKQKRNISRVWVPRR